MKNKNHQAKRFISIVFVATLALFTGIQVTQAAASNPESFKENFTKNWKACLRTYAWAYEEGPSVSCQKEVSSTCQRNVQASCTKDVKQKVYKTIMSTCYRTETQYKNVTERYNSTCYRTETQYRNVTRSYRSTCYRTTTVRTPVYGVRYGRRYVRYYSTSRRTVPYSCTKTTTQRVASGTRRVSYSCNKTRTKRVPNGTQRVPYSCSQRVLDREKIVKSIYACTKKQSYVCKKYVRGICAGPKKWNPKKWLASSKCKPDDPSLSLAVEGIKSSIAKKGEQATVSFYADEENVDYYEVSINGIKQRVSSNRYSINTENLGKGKHTIKVKSCNAELGCSAEKSQELKVKKYALPFLE